MTIDDFNLKLFLETNASKRMICRFLNLSILSVNKEGSRCK